MAAITASVPHRRVWPADGLLHPVALAAIAVLAINDHILKDAYPGLVTGKLSDLAGLIFFPLLLQAGWEIVRSVGKQAAPSGAQALAVAVALTGLVFAAIKLSPAAADLVGMTIGWLQWVAALGSRPGPIATQVVADWTDLVTLPAVVIAWAMGTARIKRAHRA